MPRNRTELDHALKEINRKVLMAATSAIRKKTIKILNEMLDEDLPKLRELTKK